MVNMSISLKHHGIVTTIECLAKFLLGEIKVCLLTSGGAV